MRSMRSTGASVPRASSSNWPSTVAAVREPPPSTRRVKRSSSVPAEPPKPSMSKSAAQVRAGRARRRRPSGGRPSAQGHPQRQSGHDVEQQVADAEPRSCPTTSADARRPRRERRPRRRCSSRRSRSRGCRPRRPPRRAPAAASEPREECADPRAPAHPGRTRCRWPPECPSLRARVRAHQREEDRAGTTMPPIAAATGRAASGDAQFTGDDLAFDFQTDDRRKKRAIRPSLIQWTRSSAQRINRIDGDPRVPDVRVAVAPGRVRPGQRHDRSMRTIPPVCAVWTNACAAARGCARRRSVRRPRALRRGCAAGRPRYRRRRSRPRRCPPACPSTSMLTPVAPEEESLCDARAPRTETTRTQVRRPRAAWRDRSQGADGRFAAWITYCGCANTA